MRFNEGIYDLHVHTHSGYGVDAYLRNGIYHLRASGLDGENLLCVRLGRSFCTTDALALLLKAMHPGKFTVFCHASLNEEGFDCTPEGIRAQVQSFIDAGADGLKLGDGNAAPDVPLDAPLFDPLFDLLEETGFPLLYHVGNPTYLPERRVLHKITSNLPWLSSFKYRPGIDDDKEERSHYSQEQLDARLTQMDNLLGRHPKAKVIFAHTLFLSADIDRLGKFLDRHPSAYIDLTPCPEIYYNFSKNTAKSRDFFTTYQDRILFGTDNYTEGDPAPQIALIRNFLETDESFFAVPYGFDVTGIAPLPDEVLAKIYKGNFMRICEPRPLSPKKAATYCEGLYEQVKDFEELPDSSKSEVLEAAKRLRAL